MINRLTAAAFNRKLKGQKIERVDFREFPDGRGELVSNPVIQFSDGSSMHFTSIETDVGEYGMSITFREGGAAFVLRERHDPSHGRELEEEAKASGL